MSPPTRFERFLWNVQLATAILQNLTSIPPPAVPASFAKKVQLRTAGLLSPPLLAVEGVPPPELLIPPPAMPALFSEKVHPVMEGLLSLFIIPPP